MPLSLSRFAFPVRSVQQLSPATLAGLFLIVVLGLHAVIRLLLWQNLEFDEAEQLVFVQRLAAGYSEQPPLYTWLLWLPVQLFGPSVAALATVKFGLFAALLTLVHRVAIRVIDDPRLAALATIAPLMLPVFGWEAIRMSTHTILMCVMMLATLLTVLRIVECGQTRDYFLLGLYLVGGLLSKYNFAVYALALALASATIPIYRARFLNWRILISILLVIAFVTPHAIWLLENRDRATQGVLKYSRHVESLAPWLRWAMGLRSLGWTLFVALLPFVAAALFCFRTASWTRITERHDRRLLVRFTTLSMILVLVTVFGGVSEFRAHWFSPLLLIVPIGFFSFLQSVSTQSIARFAAIVIALSIAAIIGRSVALGFDYERGKYQSRDFLYAELPVRMQSDGIVPQHIVTNGIIPAGYLRMHFPEVPVTVSPKRWSEGQTLAVWDASVNAEMPLELKRGIATPGTPIVFDAPNVRFKSATRRLAYVIISH
jgi:4-amino-4-deoxy-L-arabinose transferase-like glycosyltransferase